MRVRVMAMIGMMAMLGGTALGGTAAGAGEPADKAAAAPTGRPMAMVPQALVAVNPPATSGADAGKPQPPAAAVSTSSAMAVQRSLSRLGYDPGPVDGRMGSKTKAAIAAYEEDRGWEPSGTITQRLQDQLAAEVGTDVGRTESGRAGAPSEPAAAPSAPVALADRSFAVPASRWADEAEEGRRVAAAQQRGPVETAVVEFFNAVRDMTVFVVRSAIDDAPARTEVANSY